MMQDELTTLRKDIDSVDEQLVRLLNERAAVVLKIGKLKIKHGTKAYDPARERVVLDHIDKLNKGPLHKGAMEEIFATIITVCREIQIKK
ncbi:MAG TPA: chorismate mutase [Candidatus Saccharimonadales bacterium]|nr:chorismate mutase [Candidatus Saccharimonadales bacterium]